MADHRLIESEPLRRRRRGPPPRLYVIARQSPVPWLRIRRLGEADRPALLAHFQGLAAAERRLRNRGGMDEAAMAASLSGLDFRGVIAFGAVAGNALIAAACGVQGAESLEVVTTEDPAYRQRGLGAMLAQQVLGAQQAAALPCGPADATAALLRLMVALGGQAAQPHAAEEA